MLQHYNQIIINFSGDANQLVALGSVLQAGSSLKILSIILILLCRS